MERTTDENRGDGSVMERPGKMWPQCFAAVTVCFSAMLMGTALGWTGPALNQLMKNSTEAGFVVTSQQGDWIGCLMPVGALFGGLIGGYFIAELGRKTTLFLTTFTFTSGFLCLVCANDVSVLYAGRVICGLSSGLVTVACPTYLAETVSPHVRGALGTMLQVMVTFGVLYIDVVGAFCSWRWMSVWCIAIIIFWGFLMFFIPESPTYLFEQRMLSQARDALEFLRGTPQVDDELALIQNSLEEAAQRRASFRDLRRPENLKPLLLSLMLMFGQQMSGVNAILFYSVNIFEGAHTNMNSFVENIIIGTAQFVATIVGALVLDKLGRRALLLTSGFFMLASITGLGAYFYIQSVDPDKASTIVFLPLTCLCVFIFSFSLGFGGIPWLIMSELMAPEIKPLAGSILSASNWFFGFLVTGFFGDFSKAVGLGVAFWSFGGCILITSLGVLMFLPETKGHSLEEIQQIFRPRSATYAEDERRIIADDVETDEDEDPNEP